MDSEKKSMLKDALILFAITLVAGLLLGFVYDVTKEPIAQQKAKAKAAKEAVISRITLLAPARIRELSMNRPMVVVSITFQ